MIVSAATTRGSLKKGTDGLTEVSDNLQYRDRLAIAVGVLLRNRPFCEHADLRDARTVIKAIFWDNDGVLVDTEELYFQATQEVLHGIGIDLSPQQYAELFLVHSRGAWHLAAELGFTPAEVERLRERRNTRYGEMLGDTLPVMDGVMTLLAALHGQYAMGIVTSSRRDHFDIIHRSTGLLGYFDFVLTADDCTYTKPHPELYLKAIEKSGCLPDECLAVEDSVRGLSAATAAGVKCVVVPTPLTQHGDFSGAHQVLTHIADLRGLLAGANARA